MRVPFVDLSRHFRSIEAELASVFVEVGRSGGYILGERVECFERKLADLCGVSHVIGVGDGTDALFLILKALGVGPGDEVITAPNSFIATAGAVVAAGAKPVFVDVADDFNIDPERIESAVTARTRAILPVHLTGRPARMDEIGGLARRRGLLVIEDAAQAIGARYRGRPVGSLGDAAGFSLHPIKLLGIYGDGGFISTNDSELDSRLRKLRNHGLRNRDECEMWGVNSRLDALQAALGEVKLACLDGWNARCRQIAALYCTELAGCVQVPVSQPWEECVYHNFVIRTDRRDALMAHLGRLGVDTRIRYPIPIHLQEAARGLGYKAGDFPNTERQANTMLSLPLYPELTDDEVAHVIEAVRTASRIES